MIIQPNPTSHRRVWNPDIISGILVLEPDQLRSRMHPSDNFMTFEAVAIVAQAVFMPGSLISKGIFFVSNALTRRITEAHSTPLSTRVTSLFKRVPNDGISRAIASIAVIAGVSLAAYALYSLSTYSLVYGAIFSIHSLLLRDFSYAPQSAVEPGLISLRSLIETDRVNFITNEGTKNLNESRSEMIASVAFLVTSVGLTTFCGNPIIANTVAYPAAASIKALALHVLTENTIHQQAQI
jgi:hypothetical protein